MSEYKTIKFPKNSVLCREGEEKNDLFYVQKGKLLICSRSGHMVTPLAHITAGEYFGELSFFDKLPRSADVVVLEDTELTLIPPTSLKDQFPTWLLIMAKQMTKKVRLMDSVIKENGIKKKNHVTMKALSIDEQRHLYKIITG
jgi:CRP-like cAMP-binding protein